MGGTAADTTRRLPPHERIVEVARELFCRDGIHATGIDRILTEAGASKMTLYGRFGSKEALVREVLGREGAEQRETFFKLIDAASPDPATRLHAVVPALRVWFERDRFYGCAFMNATAEHAKGQTGREGWLRDMTIQHHAAILGYLGNLAQAAGCAEPRMVARQILLIMDGAIAAMMVSGDLAVLDVSARNLDAVLQAVLPPA
ncbi:MAG: TetR/AcrR family transcriptional regulator [Gemmatimonadaceae bacterium]|nr:TetR/AcrR family transcriptional regulator [Acetobacteraceae bacterium]